MTHPESHGSPLSALMQGPWSADPIPWTLLILSGLAYTAGVVRLWRQHGARPRGLRWWEPLSFAAGWLTIVGAQVSPLDWLSGQLFSAHMTQHELLMLIAAPLLVLGRPLVVMLWALPTTRRRAAGALARRPLIARPWRLLTTPLIVWILHGAALWLWHLPSWYQAAVADDTIHLVQHACFLGTAALFWWTLVHGRYGRGGYGIAVLYVFTTMLHSGMLGALLTFSPHSWYPVYAERAPAWNLAPLEDQQLAGLIMWIPFGVVFLVVGLALFAAWLGESERRRAHGSVEAAVQAAREAIDRA
jgi:putative membrane protein